MKTILIAALLVAATSCTPRYPGFVIDKGVRIEPAGKVHWVAVMVLPERSTGTIKWPVPLLINWTVVADVSETQWREIPVRGTVDVSYGPVRISNPRAPW